jgi:hypothetical protein
LKLHATTDEEHSDPLFLFPLAGIRRETSFTAHRPDLRQNKESHPRKPWVAFLLACVDPLSPDEPGAG